MSSLRDILDSRVREGDLYEKLDRNRVRCYACGHCCPIPEGQPGVCKVRFNRGGKLYVPWGYVGGVQCDPIEKKPFFHAYPGALAYSFGMLGCDLHCGYCQNWVTSQALRDPDAVSPPLEASPEALVRRRAAAQEREVLVSTYNEPLITAEWAVAVFRASQGGRAEDRIRFERQRHAAGAGISASVDRSLQGGPEEFRRPSLSRARRTDRADSRHDSQPARDGRVAGDRHAADPRLQRLGRRTARG